MTTGILNLLQGIKEWVLFELAKYVPVESLGKPGGVATLGEDGKIDAEQMPEGAFDIVECASLSEFPETGEAGKIYVAKDTNKIYRWNNTEYVMLSVTDLSNYYTKGEVDSIADTKADADNVYDKAYIDDVEEVLTSATADLMERSITLDQKAVVESLGEITKEKTYNYLVEAE